MRDGRQSTENADVNFVEDVYTVADDIVIEELNEMQIDGDIVFDENFGN